MISYIFESIRQVLQSRVFYMVILVAAVFGVIVVRLFNLQIVNSEEYVNTYLEQTEKEIVTSGTRGQIYDRNGTLLAGNELSYSVTIMDTLDSSTNKSALLNEIIYNLVTILKENGDELAGSTSIGYEDGEFVYTTSSESARIRFLKDIYGLTDLVTEDGTDYSLNTAEETYEYLCSKYSISDEYSIEDALDIIYIRIELSAILYQKYKSVTVATNISDESVAAIYEHEADLAGVSVEVKSTRVYYYGKYVSHILGYTGTISESQLEEYTEAGLDYNSSDVVGKSGIESYMETTLQGTKGTTTVSVNSTGKILEVLDTVEAEAGQDVYLTIDIDLQIACYNLLEQELAGILVSKIVLTEPDALEEDSLDIPVKQVYFQLINNNIVDITILNREDATENEKNVYRIYSEYEAEAISFLELAFSADNDTPLNSWSDERQEYIESCYDMLTDTWGIIDDSLISSSDTTKTAWNNGTISVSEWLTYCISQNAVSLSNLGITDDYTESSVIFDAIVAYIFEHIDDNTTFAKLIYEQLIYGGQITPSQVCMLLYNQGILEEDAATEATILSGSAETVYNFIIDKISSLEITPGQLALDPCSGSVVVTDPDTGDVLACVTYPSYDNNYLSGTIDSDYWNQLLNDQASPLYNRATQTRTAPGSTFKMMTAITALEEGIITPTTTITDRGIFTLVTPSPKCWVYPGGHGAINVSNALRVSCNYFFYQVGYWLGTAGGTYSDEAGLATLEKYASQFGLTSKTGIEIDENEPIFSTDDIVRSAIGQGSHSYSNVQINRYVMTIANGGYNYELTLIDHVEDSDGENAEDYESELSNVVNLQDSTWEAVTTGMRLVISNGSVKSIFSELESAGIKVAGKSGTAQENKLRSNHSIFVTMSPYEDPEIVTSVVMLFAGGSSYAAELSSKVLQYYYGLITLDDILGGEFTEITETQVGD
ncbi:MAG: hypothetical protein LUE29_12375 [Lachnospiraceae bacterium]|nr:hypothetical protein [Lachnospiraceae bacterium]